MVRGVGFGGPKPNGLLTGRPFSDREFESSLPDARLVAAGSARALLLRALARQPHRLVQHVNPCKQGPKQKNPATSRARGSLLTGRYGSSVPLTEARSSVK